MFIIKQIRILNIENNLFLESLSKVKNKWGFIYGNYFW